MKSKRALIALAILIVLLAAMFFLQRTFSPKAEIGQKTITVLVNHLNGDKKTLELKTDAEYLRGALEKLWFGDWYLCNHYLIALIES